MATGTNSENQDMVMSVESLMIDGVPVALTGAEFNVLDGVTPGTAIASKAMVTDGFVGITGFRDTRATPVFKQPAPQTATGTATLTTAQILAGILNGTPAAAAAYTLPLASALETALIALYPGLANDDAFDFTVQNLSVTDGQDITMTTNTGWTLSGYMLVGSNNATTREATAVTFRARRTAANTYTLYRVAG